MPRKTWSCRLRWACLPLAVLAGSAWANPAVFYRDALAPERYAYATLGVGDVSVSHPEVHPRLSDFSLNRFGFYVQIPHNREALQYGSEWGINLGYDRNHELSFQATGDSARISVRSELWMGDASLGGFVSVRPNRSWRLHLSGGPALFWGRMGRESPSRVRTGFGGSDDASVSINYDRLDGGSDLTLGSYIQTGVEFVSSPSMTVGLSLRYTQARLRFSDQRRLDLTGPTYALTLGYHF